MSYRYHKRLSIVAILLFGLAMMLFGRQRRLSAEPANLLRQAWQNSERAGAYRFESRLTQTTIPARRITAAGQPGRQQSLFVDGSSDRRAGTLDLRIWDEPQAGLDEEHAIAMRVEGSRAFGRSAGGQWQPLDDISQEFAPAGDAAAFLGAAKHVMLLGRETRELPLGEGRTAVTTFDRYRFVLDGDRYAEILRDQLQAELQRTGELPAGVTLAAADHFKQMFSEGEAWIDADGLPLRIQLSMEYPQLANGERLTSEIVTTFKAFDGRGAHSGWWGRIDSGLSAIAVSATSLAEAAPRDAIIVALGLLLAMALLRLQSDRHYNKVAWTLSLQMAFAPFAAFADSAQMQQLTDRYPQMAVDFPDQLQQAQQALAQTFERAQEQLFDIYQSPLQAGRDRHLLQTKVAPEAATGQPRAVTSVDGDKDGLEDSLEGSWFTSATDPDHDDDGLNDGDEVKLCPERSGWFNGNNEGDPACPDPYYADTDLDGLSDSDEVLYLGTLAQMKDSDQDGITDHAEVQGFLLPDGSKRVYSDPLNADSDRDGLLDGNECPEMRRTLINDDYRGSSAGNSPWNSTIKCDDTDGDNIPDIFDLDSDGDGVADRLDTAPTSFFGKSAPFDGDTPFELQLENLGNDKPLLIDFQLRPVVPEHLTYALNVLDWPSGDYDGQIQRGIDDTFADLNSGGTRAVEKVDSGTLGDMRLTPMLEVTLPGNTINLPRTEPTASVELNTRGRLVISLSMVNSGADISVSIFELAFSNVFFDISKGNCAVNSPGTFRNNVNAGETFLLQNRQLELFANGEHVLQIVTDDAIYCEPIPQLNDGAVPKTTMTLRDPGVAIGQVDLEYHSASAGTEFNFTFDDGGSYDVTVFKGDCQDDIPTSPTPTTWTNVQNGESQHIAGQDVYLLVDGDHAMRLKQNDKTVACAPLGNLVSGAFREPVDQATFDSYQITWSEEEDGTLRGLVPLTLATDQRTGRTEAFQGRLFLESNVVGDVDLLPVRLVWMVTTLTDSCPNADCFSSQAVRNQVSIVHRYPNEQWYLTGLEVTEEHDLEVAVIFEDPATETDTVAEKEAHEVEWDDELWQLSGNLEQIFLDGVDRDGNDERDVDIGEIGKRWDTGPSTEDQRWGIPSDALVVEQYSLGGTSGMGNLNNLIIPDLLDTHFGDGSFDFRSVEDLPSTQVYPTLLFATERKTRVASLEADGNLSSSGARLTVDFNPNTANRIDPVTITALSWKPYRYSGDAWEPMPITDYWNRLEKVLPLIPSFDASTDSEGERFEALANIRLAQVEYVRIFNGLGNAVELNTTPEVQNLWQVSGLEAPSDNELKSARQVAESTGKNFGGLLEAHLKPIFEELDEDFRRERRLAQIKSGTPVTAETTSFRQNLGRGIDRAARDFTGFGNLFDPTKNLTTGGKLRTAGGLVTSASASLMVGAAASLARVDGENNTTQQKVASVLEGVAAAHRITDVVKIGYSYQKLAQAGTAKPFKALQTAMKANKAAKIVAVVGLVIEFGLAFGLFIYQMVSADIGLFSIQFNAALAGVAANLIISVAMALLATTGIGAIVVAILGLIDGLIALFCGIAPPDEESEDVGDVIATYTCKGISGLLSELVAYVIYDVTDIIDVDNSNRLQVTTYYPHLAEAATGFIPGADVHFDVDLSNTVETQTWDPGIYFFYIGQFNEDNTRKSAFAYDVVAAKESDPDKQLHNDVVWKSDYSSWVALGDDKYRLKKSLAIRDDSVELTTAGINVHVPAFLAEGYAAAAQECMLIPNPIPPLTPPVIPVCYVRARRASNYLDLKLTYDIFPATLSEFYTLAPVGDGFGLAWGQDGQVTFPLLQDADGDGLTRAIDPDDSKVDSDGDGATDLREKQLGSDPSDPDSDDDGDLDGLELHYGTNPLLADGDGDGLSDPDERAGWSIGYNPQNGTVSTSWAYSNPNLGDEDNDKLNDRRERSLGFNPHVASDPTFVDYSMAIHEPDAPLLLMHFDESSAAVAFADSSSPGSTLVGTCATSSCPAAGFEGIAVNGGLFGGDPLTLGYVEPINSLSDSFSISAWVKPSFADGINNIVSIGQTNGRDGFTFGLFQSTLMFIVHNQSGEQFLIGTAASAVTVGSWSHVGVVITHDADDTTAAFYVNGNFTENVTVTTGGVIASTNDDVLIGGGTQFQSTTTWRTFDGMIDELAIYDRPLSATEMFLANRLIFNADDSIVDGDQSIEVSTDLQSKLLVRNIEGVVQTELPPMLNEIAPRNVTLAPLQRLETERYLLDFDTTAPSGDYEIVQTLGAIIDQPPEPLPLQDADLVYNKMEDAVTFNGTSNYRRAPASSDLRLDSSDFTIMLWLNPDDFSSKRRGVFGWHSGETDGYPSVQLIGSDLVFGYASGSWQEQQVSNAIPNDGEWHHVAISFDRSNAFSNSVASVYIDGTLKATLNFGVNPPTSTVDRFDIGRSSQSAKFRFTEFSLTCEADGAGDGRYDIAYRRNDTNSDHNYWGAEGSDGANWTISTGWVTFEDSVNIEICENDSDSDDHSTCDDNDELMKNSAFDSIVLRTYQQSYSRSDQQFSTTPNDPTCGFWDGYDDTATVDYEFENQSIPYDGQLKGVRLYKRALSVTDINNVLSGEETLARFKLDDRPDSTLFNDWVAGSVGVCTRPACPTTGVRGKENIAAQFDGVDDYIAANNVSKVANAHVIAAGSDGFTFGAWVNVDPSMNGTKTIAGFHTSTGLNLNLLTALGDGNGGVEFRYYDDSTSWQGTGVTHSAGVWYLVFVEVDASDNGRIVVREPEGGFAEKTFTTSMRPTTNGRFTIGQDWDGNNKSEFFKGTIDELFVIGDAIDIDQELALFHAGPGYTFDFDDGTRYLTIDSAPQSGSGCDCNYSLIIDRQRRVDMWQVDNLFNGTPTFDIPIGGDDVLIQVYNYGAVVGSFTIDAATLDGSYSEVVNGRYSGSITLNYTVRSYASSDQPTLAYLANLPKPVAGQIYGALEFDPSKSAGLPAERGGDVVGAGGIGSGDLTVTAWVQGRDLKKSGTTIYRPVVGSYAEGEPDANDNLFLGFKDGLAYMVVDGTIASAPTAIAENTWTHLAYRVDYDDTVPYESVITLFVNGSEVASTSINGQPGYAWYYLMLGMGLHPDGSSNPLTYFSGVIDEVTFYRAALEERDIVELYNFQQSWVDENSKASFTVDNTKPTHTLNQTNAVLALKPQTLVIETSDAHSFTSIVELIAESGAGQRQFARRCDDDQSSTAFCYAFDPVTEGEYDYIISVTDASGNSDLSIGRHPFYVDGTAPTVTLDPLSATPFAPELDPEVDAQMVLKLSGTVSDPQLSGGHDPAGVEWVEVRLDRTNQGQLFAGARQRAALNGNSWSLDYVLADGKVNGEFSGKIIVRDNVGNERTVALAPFTTDSSAPLSLVTNIDAPTTSYDDGSRAGGETTAYLNGSSTLDGTVSEQPPGVPVVESVAGVQGVEVGFEPVGGAAFFNPELSTALWIYLPFDEGDRTADDPNNSYRDVISDIDAICSADCPEGGILTRNGQGVYFDGVDDQLSLGIVPGVTDRTNGIAIGAWIRLDDTSGVQRISAPARTNSNNGWGFATVGSGLRFTTYNVKDYDLTSVTLQADIWYHVAAFMSPSNDVTFFLNGEQVGTIAGTSPANANSDDPQLIGMASASGSSLPSDPFGGVIDELFIATPTTFGEAEVQELMGDGPVMHLTFDQPRFTSGEMIADAGGMDTTATACCADENFSRPGIVGSHAIQFGPDAAQVLNIAAAPTVLVDDAAPWSLSFWHEATAASDVAVELDSLVGIDHLLRIYVSPLFGQIELYAGDDSHFIPLSDVSGWHHYAFVWDGSQLISYLDGQPLSSWTPTNPLFGSAVGSFYVENLVQELVAFDDLRFYKRQLVELEVAAAAASGWQPATLTTRSPNGIDATWSAGVPQGLEGIYAVKTRGSDAAGNVDDEPQAVWAGAVDSLAPRVTLNQSRSGGFSYEFTVADFNLNTETLNLPDECDGVTTYEDVSYDSPWYTALASQSGEDVHRTVLLTMVCTVPTPLANAELFSACDLMGNCSAVSADGQTVPLAVDLTTMVQQPALGPALALLLLALALAGATLAGKRRRRS